MGAQSADVVVARRSKPRAYLLLARVSNLPTVWTNVLAACVVAGAAFDSLPVALLSMSLLYTGGMFLNDAFDARFDSRARPDRPIPSGDVTRRQAFATGFGLLLAGEALLALQPVPAMALGWGALLVAAIVFYDFAHKGVWFAPAVMGLCRALIYPVAAAGATGSAAPVVAPATAMFAYVVVLTHIAKAGRGDWVPWLLAGICIVDAGFIAVAGAPLAAAAAGAGFVVTLALQRVVPGT